MEDKVEEVTTVTHSPEAVVKTTRQVKPEVHTEHPQKVFEKKKVIFRSHQIIWYILVFIEVMLGFRVTLLALGANPSSGFANLIYTVTGSLVAPFQGILPTTVPTTGGQVFEWATLIASVVYAFVAIGIVYLIQLVKPVSPQEVSEAVDNTVA